MPHPQTITQFEGYTSVPPCKLSCRKHFLIYYITDYLISKQLNGNIIFKPLHEQNIEPSLTATNSNKQNITIWLILNHVTICIIGHLCRKS